MHKVGDTVPLDADRVPVTTKKQRTALERVESCWRSFFEGSPTTKLVNVRFRRREPSGSFIARGSLESIDSNDIHNPDRLIPYGGRVSHHRRGGRTVVGVDGG